MFSDSPPGGGFYRFRDENPGSVQGYAWTCILRPEASREEGQGEFPVYNFTPELSQLNQDFYLSGKNSLMKVNSVGSSTTSLLVKSDGECQKIFWILFRDLVVTTAPFTRPRLNAQCVMRCIASNAGHKYTMVAQTCHNLTRTCHNLTRTCHNSTRTCNNLTRTCHNLTRT